MWEHAEAIIGIPEAVKATLDIIKHFRPAKGKDVSVRIKAAEEHQRLIRDSIQAFAVDAVELAAWKELHAITNSFSSSLKETFSIVGVPRERARQHHQDTRDIISLEFFSLHETQRAGDAFARLRINEKFMRYLASFPPHVMEKVPFPPWDDYFWKLLKQAETEVENFGNFYTCAANLRGLNRVLNNLADQKLKDGIEKFNGIMEKLRTALDHP
jgi:hypothetical protein